ncbi:S4 domain-containing protein [Pseudomonadales bacterium]|jgi:ribosome-associated heat shock protein Hsp15|nr:S4 domain-containing protein [Pseudomonadales bacterium]MDG1703495.1 S4 domain-containing protein [Pseudomonadales bacterium]
MSGVRIDRWLWAARFFKTRSLAKAAVEGGKVHLESSRVKPSKEVQVGQQLEIRRGDTFQVVIIETLSEQRGSATVAQTLYTETPESIEQREVRKSVRRMERAGLNIPSSKPDKKNRRALAQLKDLDRNWQHSPDD